VSIIGFVDALANIHIRPAKRIRSPSSDEVVGSSDEIGYVTAFMSFKKLIVILHTVCKG
jgi:hypothetical protein